MENFMERTYIYVLLGNLILTILWLFIKDWELMLFNGFSTLYMSSAYWEVILNKIEVILNKIKDYIKDRERK